MSIGAYVRFQVMNRDGFRCAYCGATAYEQKLEVDHIIPVSEGGISTLGNLITACKPCNMGKNKYQITSSVPVREDSGESKIRNPQDAPEQVVKFVTSEAQALKVSIVAAGIPQEYVAAAIGVSAPYLSFMVNGKRPIPHKLVGPLCAATGSNLLRQFIQLQRALEQPDEVQRLAQMLREHVA